jgi:hypothetical protein
MCSSSPGQGHSYRAGSLTVAGRRDSPARLSSFQTLECATPVAPATTTGLAATVTDPRLQIGCEQPRRAMRPARAIEQGARLAAASQPAMPPAMRPRRREVESGRGRLQRETVLDRAHQRETASQSELGVSVQIHPRPLRAFLFGGERSGPCRPFVTADMRGSGPHERVCELGSGAAL